ncbi:YggS family pyridoxal phosphate-dependent enzyme [Flavihumibacter rivuli]|uniref:YggS family pyridoxal phosphate-dependent enzyme n=1 Tax=Flavihumibacter rivuli TaxID=2838156 RepID=UPI001BDEE0D5|nr:YggS family pyridoxal phosphate-dependent enzyme [Flavihumibacter rivuli]ULQ57976.1 YggS family pyridoxal phosphate-dependent enzyme [Flavihumibacter rivuli]
MAINEAKYQEIKDELREGICLVAVSKTKPADDIMALYELGQRDFGENYVQELVDKQSQLPGDIHWHFIGHLQSNKVKYIAPFVHLVHGVDSPKLLAEINKQAIKNGRVIDVLLQIHIATEETKFGMDEYELMALIDDIVQAPDKYAGVRIRGLMGMASFSDNLEQVRNEFRLLKRLYDAVRSRALNTAQIQPDTLSMGMSGDYRIAIDEGSNMVRIGSLLFGARG